MECSIKHVEQLWSSWQLPGGRLRDSDAAWCAVCTHTQAHTHARTIAKGSSCLRAGKNETQTDIFVDDWNELVSSQPSQEMSSHRGPCFPKGSDNWHEYIGCIYLLWVAEWYCMQLCRLWFWTLYCGSSSEGLWLAVCVSLTFTLALVSARTFIDEFNIHLRRSCNCGVGDGGRPFAWVNADSDVNVFALHITVTEWKAWNPAAVHKQSPK